MAKYVGSAVTVTFGSLITANLIRDVSIEETGDLIESTGAGDTSKSYLSTGIKDGTCTINFIDDDSNASVLDKFEPLTTGTLTVVKAGAETITGTAFVRSRTVQIGYNSLAVGTAVLQFSGAVTHV